MTSSSVLSEAQLSALSKEELVAKLVALQIQGRDNSAAPSIVSSSTSSVRSLKARANAHADASSSIAVSQKPKPKPSSRPYDFHTHPTRKIALLFSYQGWPYSGLAIQARPTPLPTVEQLLLSALEKTHLIEVGKGWEGCDFARCGRTDRGVSSAGQVATLVVKSKRKKGDGGEELGEDWREPRIIGSPKVRGFASLEDVDEASGGKEVSEGEGGNSQTEDSSAIPSPGPILDPSTRARLLESFKNVSTREERIAWQIENGINPNLLTLEQRKLVRKDPSMTEEISLQALTDYLDGRNRSETKQAKRQNEKDRLQREEQEQSKDLTTGGTAGAGAKKESRGTSGGRSGPTEYAYVSMLNRVLPPEIRVLAWSPLSSDPEFHARFSCLTRHYRYFFSTRPIPNQPALDLEKMQRAADLLIGNHDFRNFCKLDGSKQIENYCRTIVKAVIRRNDGSKMVIEPTSQNPDERHDDEIGGQRKKYDEDCVFELVGSAFLWHQVRHIMAILFLVGHGLEDPSIITSLLNVGPQTQLSPIPERISTGEPTQEEEGEDAKAFARRPNPQPLNITTPFLPTKPIYYMAAAVPLQLYDCSFGPGSVQWRYSNYDGTLDSDQESINANEGNFTLLNQLRSQVAEAKSKYKQIEAFYEQALRLSDPRPQESKDKDEEEEEEEPKKPIAYHTLGGPDMMPCKRYVPLMQRERTESIEDVNRKYREGAGARRALRNATQATSAANGSQTTESNKEQAES